MIIVLKPSATKKQVDHVIERVKQLGLKPMVSRGTERTIIGVIGPEDILRVKNLEVVEGVEQVMPVLQPYRMVSKEFKPKSTVVNVKGVKIGGKKLAIMAGPDSVETYDMVMNTAKAVKRCGASILRGGAFKPRTSPYSFQGLREEGMRILHEIGQKTQMPVITEMVDTRDIDLFEKYADVIQIGARNMHNFELLKVVGKSKKPVLLKRGLAATIDEFLLAAEYIVSQGNFNVILCERGIRTFEPKTRFTLDVSAVPVIKKLSHLPVVIDPSHASGTWEYVAPLARAGIAVGADGLIMEVHPNPEEALCDGPHSLTFKNFKTLMQGVTKVAEAVGRTV